MTNTVFAFNSKNQYVGKNNTFIQFIQSNSNFMTVFIKKLVLNLIAYTSYY